MSVSESRRMRRLASAERSAAGTRSRGVSKIRRERALAFFCCCFAMHFALADLALEAAAARRVSSEASSSSASPRVREA